MEVVVGGGKNLQKILRNAGKGSVESVDIGFYSTAKYQDGTPVTNVAAWNEFGTERIPSRPFMRNTNEKVEEPVIDHLKATVDPKKMIVTPEMAEQVGVIVQGAMQEEIVDLREPPNAPSTVAAKGSSNPLVDTGKLRQSVTYKVNR